MNALKILEVNVDNENLVKNKIFSKWVIRYCIHII